jgi:hypothetical protein
MKKGNIFSNVFVLVLFIGVSLFAQQAAPDRATVPFSDPSKPGLVEVSVHNGSIKVTGYTGNQVVVEAKFRGTKIKEKEEQRDEKAKGMQRIRMTGTGLTIEEKNNVMEIHTAAHDQPVDLTIQVPSLTSLKLATHEDGEIAVENVNGEIEATNHEGDLTLKKVSGSVVAHSFDGDVLATLDKVDPDKPMSFSTFDGDIDVTFPATIKANLKMKTQEGEIYTDFEIEMKQGREKVEEDAREKGGKYRISFGDFMYGTISGGGPEYKFMTFEGNIYIRKGK